MSGLTGTGAGLVALTAAGWLSRVCRRCRHGSWSGARLVRLHTITQLPSALESGPVTVAVAVPAHNEAATIEETIRSCLRRPTPHYPCRFVLKLRRVLPASFWHLLLPFRSGPYWGRVFGIWEAHQTRE
jgi:hypothetical protein